MSDGKIKMKFCKISTCCNQPQDNSFYCLIHLSIREHLSLKTGENE